LLIIFDLDDTLIDTSGCITPYKIEAAFARLMKEGLTIESPKEALQMLKRLDETAESSRHTFSEFLEIVGADKKYFNLAIEEVYSDIPADLAIFPLDHALDVLLELKESHDLALVTVGNLDRQFYKMKKAGIDSTIFSKIIVSEDRDKKPHYRAILSELGYAPRDTFVCGDKVAIDLVPAKELGLKTIHMRWGRGRNSLGIKGSIDFAISELRQIKEILVTYQEEGS
jgi:putative hydrolase of the HAD superfamily